MGIPGFGDATDFLLIDHRPGSVFRWLQSASRPELAFVVIDALLFRPEFPVDKLRKQLEFLGLAPDESVATLAICTVPQAPAPPTANFMAPVCIGRDCRRGAQVVMHDAKYGPAESFLPQPAKATP